MIPAASDYLSDLADLFQRVEATNERGEPTPLDEAAYRLVAWLFAARTQARKVMVVGNGGSAAIASHFQVDLANAVKIRALCFDMLPQLTANANDRGYASVYEHPVEDWAEPGDILVAISSSGASENILRAAEAARERGCRVLTLSGFKADNPLRRLGHLNLHVPSTSYGQVELCHQCLLHHLSDATVMAAAARISA